MENNDQITSITEEAPQVPQVPATPPIDIEAIKQSVRDEVVADISDKLKGTASTQKELDEVDKLLEEVSFFKEGRNPKDWREAAKEVAKISARLTEERLEKKNKALEDERKKNEEAEKANEETTEKALHTYWDSQFEDLEKRGNLPPMPTEIKEKLSKGEKLTEEEQQDPSVKVRTKIYTLAIENGYDDIKHAYYELYQNSNKKPVGFDAPVSGGKGSTKPVNNADIPYDKLKRMTFDDFFTR